jgi:Rrf2 family nitric oxide-sensitive transcriptional repressor
MRLTAHTDLGLRVLIQVAVSPTGAASARDIADAHGASLHHLRKVVSALAAGGFVQTTRGRGGGVRLAHPAADIRVGAVVRALEPDLGVVECLQAGDGACRIAPACRLKATLRNATAAFLAVLDDCTLAEVAGNPRQMQALLASPQASG